MSIYAKVIADSINAMGSRLTTMEVRMHRFVLAEFNTHRVFSRNSASSRAIPIQKRIQQVIDDPAVPIEFGANQAGMQAGEALTGEAEAVAREAWLGARHDAVQRAQQMLAFGVHKQVVNRLLEPFCWHTVIVSSTSWENFFAQRCSPLAQPEIRLVAERMQGALRVSVPTVLKGGQYHLPYINKELRGHLDLEAQIRISVARCARVSYLTHDGKIDIDADLALYEKLVSADPMHASPLEHVARPRNLADDLVQRGNFLGWVQHRHEVEDRLGIASW